MKTKQELQQLNDCLKASARKNGVEINAFASRYVAEQIVTCLGRGLTISHVTGGLALPYSRQTADADLVLLREPDEGDMGKLMTKVARRLKHEGIDIKAVSAPREIHVGLNKPVQRVKVIADCVDIRANTHLDMRIADRTHEVFLSDRTLVKREPMFKGARPFVAYVQAPHVGQAEKFMALIIQKGSDYRTKHLSDLVNANYWQGVSTAELGKQLHRASMLRNFPVPPNPATLSWEHISRLEQAWEKDVNAQRLGMSLWQAWQTITKDWEQVYDSFLRYEQEFLYTAEIFAPAEMAAHIVYSRR